MLGSTRTQKLKNSTLCFTVPISAWKASNFSLLVPDLFERNISKRNDLKACCFSRGLILVHGDTKAGGRILLLLSSDDNAPAAGDSSSRPEFDGRLDPAPEYGAGLDKADEPREPLKPAVAAVSSLGKSRVRLERFTVDLLRGVSTVANKSWWHWNCRSLVPDSQEAHSSLLPDAMLLRLDVASCKGDKTARGLEEETLLERLEAGPLISGNESGAR
jgi:hypothetical protein